MSLSTLLEAAKYLDYLQSNNQQIDSLDNTNLKWQSQARAPTGSELKLSEQKPRRRSNSKKGYKASMPPMSLPANFGAQMHAQGVPIPMVNANRNNNNQFANSLSSSLTTCSPLSSTSGFSSNVLLCSAQSPTSSITPSLSSSTSSSCGDIVMQDNDFNTGSQIPSNISVDGNKGKEYVSCNQTHQIRNDNINESGLVFDGNQVSVAGSLPANASSNHNHTQQQYVAGTGAGTHLLAMPSSQAGLSSFMPGHFIRNQNGNLYNGTRIEQLQFSLPGVKSSQQHQLADANSVGINGLQVSGMIGQYNGSEADSPVNSPNVRQPIIMTRLPIILNPMSPNAPQSSMSSQNCASSPTSVSSSYSRHRELHKTLEKNRRAHLRHCFELLRSELPTSEYADKKTSHINIIKSAIKYIMVLAHEEQELKSEMQRLSKVNRQLTENLSSLQMKSPVSSRIDLQQHHLQQQIIDTTSSTSDKVSLGQYQHMLANVKSEREETLESGVKQQPSRELLFSSANIIVSNDNMSKETVNCHNMSLSSSSSSIQKKEGDRKFDFDSLSADEAAAQVVASLAITLPNRPVLTKTSHTEIGPKAPSSGAVVASPQSPSPCGVADDPQAAVETKMLLNSLANKLSLK